MEVSVSKTVRNRALNEFCLECGYPTLEELCTFKGEKLAVSTCLKCDFFDWELPDEIRKKVDPTEIKIFEQSMNWAKEEAKKIKVRFLTQKPIVFKIQVSAKDVEDFLTEKRHLSPRTRRTYEMLLLRFVKWLKEKQE